MMNRSGVFLAVLAAAMAALGISFGAPKPVVAFDALVFVGAVVYIHWQLRKPR